MKVQNSIAYSLALAIFMVIMSGCDSATQEVSFEVHVNQDSKLLRWRTPDKSKVSLKDIAREFGDIGSANIAVVNINQMIDGNRNLGGKITINRDDWDMCYIESGAQVYFLSQPSHRLRMKLPDP